LGQFVIVTIISERGRGGTMMRSIRGARGMTRRMMRMMRVQQDPMNRIYKGIIC
jgi:hypothetical protein